MSESAVFSVLTGGFLGTAARAIIFTIVPTAGADIIVNIIGSFLIGFFMFLPSIQNEFQNELSGNQTTDQSNDQSNNQLNNPAGKTKLNKRLFIGTGFLGGFTTFSYFMLSPFLSAFDGAANPENFDLISIITPNFMIQYLIYVMLIIVIGIIAAAIGKYCAEKLFKGKDGELKNGKSKDNELKNNELKNGKLNTGESKGVL